MKSISLVGVFGFAAMLSGCATITRGTTEVLVIETEPAGATAFLSSGHMCKTPCSLELKRKNAVHVKIEKQGYETIDADVRSEIATAGGAAMAGNIILGGLIGAGVDAATGAMDKLTPNPLKIKLEPATSASATDATSIKAPPVSFGATTAAPADVNLALIPTVPTCEQTNKIKRYVCAGRLPQGISRDEVLRLLGAPTSKSEDGSVLRYEDYYFRFDGLNQLRKVSPVDEI